MNALSGVISHSARLPCGHTAEFTWRDGHMTVEWSPAVPDVRNSHHRRKLFEAYTRARAKFMEMVAASVDGRIAVVDLEAARRV